MTEDLVSNRLYRKMFAFGKKHHIPFNIVSPDSKIITGDHDVDLMVYTQAYENSATLYIRQPDELPADFEIAKGCFVGKEQLIDQWEEIRVNRQKRNHSLSKLRSEPNELE